MMHPKEGVPQRGANIQLFFRLVAGGLAGAVVTAFALGAFWLASPRTFVSLRNNSQFFPLVFDLCVALSCFLYRAVARCLILSSNYNKTAHERILSLATLFYLAGYGGYIVLVNACLDYYILGLPWFRLSIVLAVVQLAAAVAVLFVAMASSGTDEEGEKNEEPDGEDGCNLSAPLLV